MDGGKPTAEGMHRLDKSRNVDRNVCYFMYALCYLFEMAKLSRVD